MANKHCTGNNPKFQNIESPFIKLFELLPQLAPKGLPNPHIGLLKDLHHHAENGVEEILMSLPSLGILLATAADNTEMGLLPQDVSQIGWLIHSLSHMLIACNNLKENMGYELAKRGEWL